MTVGEIQQPYKHDCDTCEWAGWITNLAIGKNGLGNVYIHNKTVIIRYGDEGHEYITYSVAGSRKGPVNLQYLKGT